MASTEPKRAVPMVAEFIVSIGMHEYVERSMIQRKPSDDVGELGRREPDLVAPSWMGSHFSFVKAAHLNPVAKLCCRCFAKFPGGIAADRIEIDMRMPPGDTRNIEILHPVPWVPRALPSIRLQFNLAPVLCRAHQWKGPPESGPFTYCAVNPTAAAMTTRCGRGSRRTGCAR